MLSLPTVSTSCAPRQRFDDEDVESVHLFDRPLDLRNAWSRPASAASRVRQRFSVRGGVPAYTLFAPRLSASLTGPDRVLPSSSVAKPPEPFPEQRGQPSSA
jgi:hypothetical protein